MSITYDKFFRITNCDAIIFFEDDFAFENSKESLFYGLTRLNCSSREKLFIELKEAGADFVDILREYTVIALSLLIGKMRFLGMILKYCSQLLKVVLKKAVL